MTEAADLSTQDFTALADLASARVGGRAVATSDDFFAPMSALIKAEASGVHPRQSTRAAASGWTDGNRAAGGHPGTTGVWSRWGCAA